MRLLRFPELGRMSRVSRRGMLQALGSAAVLTPFVPLLEFEREARAVTPQRKLVLFWGADGPWYETYTPKGTEYNFTLGQTSGALERHKSDIIILGGVNKIPGNGDPSTVVNAHAVYTGASWTAHRHNKGSMPDGEGGNDAGWVLGPSVDQFIAQRLGLKVETLAVLPIEGNNAPCMFRTIFSAPESPVTPEDNPFHFYETTFAGAVGGDTGQLQQLIAERKSVIDFVRGDLNRLHGTIGVEDRRKLEAHLEALATIEGDLEGNVETGCAEPDLGGVIDHAQMANGPMLSSLQIRLIALGLACDLFQIASLQISKGSSGLFMAWLDAKWPKKLHEIGHEVESYQTPPEVYEPARTRQQLADTWMQEQFALLLDELKASGVFDDTLVVYQRELSSTNFHTTHSNPFILAEGANGYFGTGRYLEYGPGEVCKKQCDWVENGQPHSKLLVSICHAMGLPDVDSFGDPNSLGWGSGPLPNLKAK